MFGFQSLQVKPEKVLRKLKDFELFCLGEKKLTPETFKTLNEELSLSTVLHSGQRYFRRDHDGKHLIWESTDRRRHDLGCINNLNIMRDCPGFHKARTLALGADYVAKSDVVDTIPNRRPFNIVTLKDGTQGVGPDYKMAMRNAVLKMHLRSAFEKANKKDIWKQYYGNC